MLLPSRREARMPRSESRRSWLETAWGFMARVSARSVTHSSPARTRACRRRSRVLLASTTNTAASPPAWMGDSSGRSFRAGRGGQRSAVLLGGIGGPPQLTVTLHRGIVERQGAALLPTEDRIERPAAAGVWPG